jgi:hypothetical protein
LIATPTARLLVTVLSLTSKLRLPAFELESVMPELLVLKVFSPPAVPSPKVNVERAVVDRPLEAGGGEGRRRREIAAERIVRGSAPSPSAIRRGRRSPD